MDLVQMYLNGVSQAYTMADAQNIIAGGERLFCAPATVTLDASLAEAALRNGMKQYGGDVHPAAVILFGLKMMFPC